MFSASGMMSGKTPKWRAPFRRRKLEVRHLEDVENFSAVQLE